MISSKVVAFKATKINFFPNFCIFTCSGYMSVFKVNDLCKCTWGKDKQMKSENLFFFLESQ
jgi:hypothetical protein